MSAGAPIPRDYLKKDKWRQVKLFDLALLLLYLRQAEQDEMIGHHDTHETVDGIEKRLNREVWVEPRQLEAALYAASMMREQGKWWHPKGLLFDEWVKRVLGKDSWDAFYNVIVKKDDQI